MQRLLDTLWNGLKRWKTSQGLEEIPQQGRVFLHVGCGNSRKPNVGRGFLGDEWQEVRLDIDPAATPDIVSSILSMPMVPTGALDAVYCAHNIEHLYPHEVPIALAEFLRVLKPDGILVLACPDLQALGQLIAADRLDEYIVFPNIGPVAALDIIYGFRPALAQGNFFMAHRTGFTLRTLVESARSAGFRSVIGKRVPLTLELWMVATKTLVEENELQQLAEIHLPTQ